MLSLSRDIQRSLLSGIDAIDVKSATALAFTCKTLMFMYFNIKYPKHSAINAIISSLKIVKRCRTCGDVRARAACCRPCVCDFDQREHELVACGNCGVAACDDHSTIGCFRCGSGHLCEKCTEDTTVKTCISCSENCSRCDDRPFVNDRDGETVCADCVEPIGQ